MVEGPLRVRSKPSTGDDSQEFEPLLETGQLLFVIDGPQRGSDYDWYLVNPIVDAQTDFGWGAVNDLGWVAAADHDGTPWLEPATVSCPAAPSLSELAAMGLKRLHCYGDRAFEFTDTVYWGARCGDPSFLSSPALMADCWSVFYWGEGSKPPEVAVPPELTDAVGPREENDIIEATIVAHMDDPAARTCEGSFYETTEFDPYIIGLWCRTTFVATSFQRISP